MMRISFAKHERPTRRVLTPVSEHVRDCKWCIVRAFFSFCKLSLTKVQLFAFKTVWLYDFHSNFSNIRWMKFIDIAIQMPGGYSWEFLVGVCGPVLQILTLFQIKKIVIFHIRFQTWGGHKTQQHKREIMSSLLRLKPQQKEFLKSISNSHITLSFLWIWNWNDEHIGT